MKYVYCTEVAKKSVPNNAVVRIGLGALTGLFAILMTVLGIAALIEGNAEGVVSFLIVGAISTLFGFLFLFFAIRTVISIRTVRSRTPGDTIVSDEKKPFYSVQCPKCGVMFDYQRADLAFRPWFTKGYVECPCCEKPIRHDKDKNTFIPHRDICKND